MNKETTQQSNPPPTILVIFGASGDLTARKLAPAIFNLSQDDLLPANCNSIKFGKLKYDKAISIENCNRYNQKN